MVDVPHDPRLSDPEELLLYQINQTLFRKFSYFKSNLAEYLRQTLVFNETLLLNLLDLILSI